MTQTADYQSKSTAAEMEAVFDGALLYNKVQPLTESEKAFVRDKIGATELGEGIKIMSHFDTLEELEAAVPKPNVGDAYSIGSVLPYNLFVYDFNHAEWRDYGVIRSSDIKARFAQNKVVQMGAWQKDTDVFEDYTYKASISLAEVTGNDFPVLAFAPSDAGSGNFCPICYAFDGRIEIWANSKPTADISIPAITFITELTDAPESGNSTKGITNATGIIRLLPGAINTNMLQSGAVTKDKLAAEAKPLVFSQKAVDVSAWKEDYTHEDFPYRASVLCNGVTANHFPTVVFYPADAISGNFAPIAETYSNGIYIYAKTKPESTLTIPNIVCTPMA